MEDPRMFGRITKPRLFQAKTSERPLALLGEIAPPSIASFWGLFLEGSWRYLYRSLLLRNALVIEDSLVQTLPLAPSLASRLRFKPLSNVPMYKEIDDE